MDETKKTTEETNEPAFTQIEGELKTRFELLPTELQQVILSSDYQTKLFELAKKHKLTYEKLGQLELETTMVLLGMTPPDEYKADIADQLALKGAALDELVSEINRDVFTPIREKLMGLYTKEEVELGEKFASEMSKAETPAVESPYREPILPKTPGINAGAVPTFTKNEFDSKKEVRLNPEKKGVDLITPIDPNRTNTAPVVSVDPYREIPVVGSNIANPIVQPLATSPLTPDEVKSIPKLEINNTKTLKSTSAQPSPTTQISGLEIMPKQADQQPKTAPVHLPQNSSETLQGIAALKSALMSDIEAKKSVAEKQPIVTKEEIIVNAPRPVQTTAPLQNMPQGPTPLTSDINPITKNGGQAQGEVFSQPIKRDSVETNELMRTIKLQFDENQINQERQAREATIQKIDSMIDFKKAGSFMHQETPVNPSTPSVEQASSIPMPMAPKFSGDILEKDHTSGQIFDSKIDMLGNKVKKTGFFGKLKNFFGNQPDQVKTLGPNETIDAVPKLSNTLAPNTVNGSNNTPSIHTPTSPVSDADVDNVKIFDEIVVKKQ
jgi:hypothetical protein